MTVTVPLQVRVALWVKWHTRGWWPWAWAVRTVDAWHESEGRGGALILKEARMADCARPPGSSS